MASNTAVVMFRRAMKKSKQGIRRKTRERLQGSTQPNLPLNAPNAHEKKLAAASKKA